jgi:hypothetical protein
MTDDEAQTLAYIEEWYKNHKTPLHLTDLGSWLSAHNISRPPEDTLTGWLARFIGEQFDIAVDPEISARRAIVPKGSDIAQAFRSAPGRLRRDLHLFPRGFLIAFCKQTTPGLTMYVRIHPSFQYQESAGPPSGDGWIPVADEFRAQQGIILREVEQLSDESVTDLNSRFEKWASATGVDLATIRRSRSSAGRSSVAASPRDDERGIGSESSSALSRLISAQDPSIRSKVVIPADIAELLLRHR